MTTKIATTNIQDTALNTLLGPKVTTIVYPGTETATDTAGGETINLTGTGFQSGCNVLVNGQSAGSVTFISSTQISFTAPASSAGTYVIYVVNPDGGTAISIPGLSYSGTPTWSTSAGSVGSVYETTSINTTLTATGDAPITYTVTSGTLPAGSTLNSSTGLLSGTAPATASSTTYNFTVQASDAQNQTTNRAFSITLNPDVVTWSSPANATSYSVFTNSAIANVTMSASSAAGGSITYTADTLPTGLSITGANIAGTPTVVANTTTTLTATSTTTRSATRTINWVVSVANDTYFKNTTLLLNGETSVTPFISDSSTNSVAMTIYGDTKPNNFNPYQGDGYYGVSFNGSADYLTTPSSTALQVAFNDFTYEMWVYIPSSATNTFIFDNVVSFGSLDSCSLRVYNDVNGLVLYFYEQNDKLNSNTGTVKVNTWYHVAITRRYVSSTSTLRMFINGVQQTRTDSTFTNYSGTYIRMGADYSGASKFTGYVSNFRFNNGTALYTSNFTPSTTPLTAISGTTLLICQSNRFIDNSTNNITLTPTGTPTISPNIPFTPNSSYSTYGSAYFDGTNDYLMSSTFGSLFDFGASGEAFTVEMWVYPTAGQISTYNPTIFTMAGASSWNETGGFRIHLGNVLFASPQTQLNYTINTFYWQHLAVVRNSGTINFYINGVSQGSFSYSAQVGSSTVRPAVSTSDSGASGGREYFTGYIADLRMVKGTAVYTANFTPPTSPLTAISGTRLLTLQYNGGANNYGIIDNGPFNNIITRSGNATQGSYSPYSVTGWSNYFDGSSAYLSLGTSSTTFGTSNFTIECWVFPTAIPSGDYGFFVDTRASGTNNGFSLWMTGTNGYLGIFDGPAINVVNSTTVVTLNQWSHVALVRNGSALIGYLNGVNVCSTTTSSNVDAAALYIGTARDNPGVTRNHTGYISNLRVVKGTAVYTSAFTPSTTPLTVITNTGFLSCQSNRFVDNSPNNSSITISGAPKIQPFSPFGSIGEPTPKSYSNYLNGTTDYLYFLPSTSLLGSGAFTLEVWCYFNSLAGTQIIFDDYNGASNGWQLWVNSSLLKFYSGTANLINGSTTLSVGIWYHFAAVRSGTTITLYVNGVSDGTGSSSVDYSDTSNNHFIGAQRNPTQSYFNGYLSNLRIVKGTAVYTTTFTPSTTPLTAIANTVLLTCQSSRMIDNSTNNFTLTASGSPKVYKYNPFGYTAQSATSYTPSIHGGSVYLDGTGDNLTIPNSAFDLTPTTWSIEYWIYPITISSATYYGLWALSTSGFRQGIYGDSGTHYLAVLSGGGGYGGFSLVASNKVITLNNWQHVALTSDGTTIRQFYNGVQTSTGTAASFSASSPTIGSWGAANYFAGYISDFRITKGSAVYTSNFVPPIQALSNYSVTNPASLLLNFTNGGIIDQHGSVVLETVGNATVSTSVKKYNSGSLYFDGTGDYLSSYNYNLYSFGTGDFTVEAWVYFITKSQYASIFHIAASIFPSGNGGIGCGLDSALNWTLYYNNNGTQTSAATGPSNGVWYHVATVKNNGVTKVYVNGSSVISVNDSGNYTTGYLLGIGGAIAGASSQMYGYIDDLRITKGYARYTANFTAPTSALITK